MSDENERILDLGFANARIEGLERERDELARELLTVSAQAAGDYGDLSVKAWNEAIEAAAGWLEEYDEWGKAASIRALKKPTP